MTKLKIAILGTRGIPNHYGGFEQLAEYLSAGLVEKGHSVTVYSSHRHPFREKQLNGAAIVHCYDPENWMGTSGQFVYDLNCVRNAGRKNFDVLLFLGYTSSSVWGRFYPKKTVIISNMDGMEWKRSKYSAQTKRFLLTAEKLAVKYSHYLIADSPAIQSYLQKKYDLHAQYIPYGAAILNNEDESILSTYNIPKGNYYMLMARMEPENNIEMILDGFHRSASVNKFIVIGNTDNKFGKLLINKFGKDKRIIFAGAIYDAKIIHTLKTFCRLYFHGHSVGGTNPSLLEAMASRAPVAAHDNEFNRAVLNEDGYYFSSADDVTQLVQTILPAADIDKIISVNAEKIKEQYNWPSVINQYESFIVNCFRSRTT
ncbi:MAG: DUF1972 domain-containing protein [Ferruginibacter sp.]